MALLGVCVACGMDDYTKCPGETLFPFPTDPLTREIWLLLIGMNERSLKSNSRVCSRHFGFGSFKRPGDLPLLKTGKTDAEKRSILRHYEFDVLNKRYHKINAIPSDKRIYDPIKDLLEIKQCINIGQPRVLIVEASTNTTFEGVDTLESIERADASSSPVSAATWSAYMANLTKYCCVPGCDSDSTTTQVRRFPVYDHNLRQEWLESFGLTDPEFRRLMPKYSFVCHRHFDSSQFIVGADGRRYLMRKAVPMRIKIRASKSIKRTYQLKEDDSVTSYSTSNDDTNDSDYDPEEDGIVDKFDRFTEKRTRPESKINQDDPKTKSGIRRFCLIKRLHDHTRYKCVVDGVAFDDVTLAWDHLKDVHGLEEESGRVGCKPCHRRFDSIHSLKKHLDGKHEIPTSKCDICGKYFADQGGVVRHKRQVHPTKPEEGTKVRCPICKCILSSHDSLQQHMHLHKGGRNYQCTECGMKFKQAAGLSGHRRHVHKAPLVRQKANSRKTHTPEEFKD